MSDMVATDPAQLAELKEQIEAMKNLFSSLRQKEQDRPKKGKVREDLNELVNSDFPVIQLSFIKHKSKKGTINESSLRSQFKATAKEMELDFEPSFIVDGENLYLANLDVDNAEAKFNQYVLKNAGIATGDLYAATTDLDTSTK